MFQKLSYTIIKTGILTNFVRECSGLDMEEEDFVDDAILGKAIANNVRKSLMYNSTVVAPK